MRPEVVVVECHRECHRVSVTWVVEKKKKT